MANGQKVSIIITTYGRPQFVLDAVNSAVGQTHSNLEIIVVDDCSPEPIVADAFAADLLIVRHRRNMGPGAARNTGLAHATGEFLTFLDDDDRLEPHRIEEGLRSIGTARMHAVATNLGGRCFTGDMSTSITAGPTPYVGQVLLRRDDVLQFDPTLRVGEDVEWWLRMRDRAVFAWSDRPGLSVRIHDEQRPGVDPLVRARCRALTAHRHGPSLDRPGRSYQYARAASGALMAGRHLDTVGFALRSLVIMPTALGMKLLSRGLMRGGWGPSVG